MLRKLLVKDFVLNGKVFLGLLWLFVWVAATAGKVSGPGLAIVIGAVAAALMTVTLGAREERFHAAATSFSLPVTRRNIVTYRYLAGHLVGVAAVFLTCLIMVAVPWSKQAVDQVFDPRTMMFAMAAVSLTIAAGMPFVLRFGVAGLFVGLGGLQVLGLVSVVAGAAIATALATRREFVRACEQTIISIHQSLGSGAYAVELLSAIALVTWASFRLSVWLVERRDV